eukprot:scaffold22759_cov54-Attheya_sp.AAC.3
MIPTPDEILTRFVTKLSCAYEEGYALPYAPDASTLPYYLSSAAGGSCSFSAMLLQAPRGMRSPSRSKSKNLSESAVAAQNLSRSMRMGRHNIALAPGIILRNVLRSFGQLLVEGFQQTIHLMIERMAESVDKQVTESKRSRREKRLTDFLKELSLVDCSPLTPIAAVIEYNIDQHAPCEDWTTEKHGKSRVVLPIQFEAAVDVLVYGKMVIPVKFQSRGTISGDFMNQKNRPDSINIEIDSDELYKAMKKQCKHVLKKAISSLSCEDDDGENKSHSDGSLSLSTMENEFGESSSSMRGSSTRSLTESVITSQ